MTLRRSTAQELVETLHSFTQNGFFHRGFLLAAAAAMEKLDSSAQQVVAFASAASCLRLGISLKLPPRGGHSPSGKSRQDDSLRIPVLTRVWRACVPVAPVALSASDGGNIAQTMVRRRLVSQHSQNSECWLLGPRMHLHCWTCRAVCLWRQVVVRIRRGARSLWAVDGCDTRLRHGSVL